MSALEKNESEDCCEDFPIYYQLTLLFSLKAQNWHLDNCLSLFLFKLATWTRLLSIYNLVIASYLHIEQIRESDWGCIPMSTLKISSDCLVPGRQDAAADTRGRYRRLQMALSPALHLLHIQPLTWVENIKVRMEKLIHEEYWCRNVWCAVLVNILQAFWLEWLFSLRKTKKVLTH